MEAFAFLLACRDENWSVWWGRAYSYRIHDCHELCWEGGEKRCQQRRGEAGGRKDMMENGKRGNPKPKQRKTNTKQNEDGEKERKQDRQWPTGGMSSTPPIARSIHFSMNRRYCILLGSWQYFVRKLERGHFYASPPPMSRPEARTAPPAPAPQPEAACREGAGALFQDR